MYTIITIYGRVKMSVMPLFIFWIIVLLDLERNFIGKLLVFRWELIVLFLLQICFFFIMREISWSLSHLKIRLTLLRLSIQLQDTLMIYDKRDNFDFDIVNFSYLDGDVPRRTHMGYTYLNLLDSPELLQILMTLTTVIKPLLPKISVRAIVILNFVRRFRNFIADTVPC